MIIEDCQEVVRNLLQESLTDSLLEYTQEITVLSYAINSLLEKSPVQFDVVRYKIYFDYIINIIPYK